MWKKMVFFFGHSKKLYQRLLVFSYLIIIVVCIAINFFAQSLFIKKFEESYINSNEQILAEIAQSVENNFKSIEETALLLANSNNAKNISNGTDASLRTDSTYVRNMMKDISVCAQASGFFSNCYIVFKNVDICITHSGKMSKEAAYEMCFSQYGQQLNILDDYIFSLPQKANYEVMECDGSLWLIYYSSEYIYTTDIAVLMKLDLSSWDKIFLKNVSTTDAMLFIFNNHEDLIYSSSSAVDPGSTKKDLGGFYSEDQFFVYNVAPVSSVRQYQYIIPRNYIVGALNWYKAISTVTLVLCAVISVLLTSLFTRKLYRPIRGLLNKLGYPQESKVPEISYIMDKIQKYSNEKKLLERDIMKMKKRQKNMQLKKVLLGEGCFQEQDMVFYADGAIYAVAVFEVLDLGKIGKPEDDEAVSLCYFAISNILSELLAPEAAVTPVEMEEGVMACIITIFNGTLQTQSHLNQIVEKTAKFLKKEIKMLFICGISETRKACNEIPVLYEHANDLLMLDIKTMDKPCISYSEALQHEIFSFSKNDMIRLDNYIKNSAAEQAEQLIRQIFDENLKKNNLSVAMQRALFLRVFHSVMNADLNFSENNTERTVEIPNFRIGTSAQINESIEKLCRFAGLLCRENAGLMKNNKNKASSVEGKVEMICKFIEGNYENPNLNVNMVAEQFNLSSAYISKIFKDYKKIGMAQYIINCRINKVKHLLCATPLSISDIAQKSGFTNANMLIRSFKKIVGITPGQYREKS